MCGLEHRNHLAIFVFNAFPKMSENHRCIPRRDTMYKEYHMYLHVVLNTISDPSDQRKRMALTLPAKCSLPVHPRAQPKPSHHSPLTNPHNLPLNPLDPPHQRTHINPLRPNTTADTHLPRPIFDAHILHRNHTPRPLLPQRVITLINLFKNHLPHPHALTSPYIHIRSRRILNRQPFNRDV